MAKKIEVIVDIDSKEVNITSDRVLTLTEQVRLLKKEIQKSGPGPEQDLLIAKFNDINDELDKTNLKSKEFLGALGTLPGPVGQFAGSLDGAVNQLRNFSSFSFKDIKAQLGGLVDDFGKIATNLGKATGITKLYTTLNTALAASFVKVGAGEAAAAAGARALSAALIATGIGALIVALGLAASALYEMATGEKEAAAQTEKLNSALEQQNTLLDLNQKSTKRRNAETIADMKAQGKSEKEIRDKINEQNYNDYTAAFNAEKEAVKLFNDNVAKANAEDLKKLQDNLDKKVEARKDAYSKYIVDGKNGQATELSEQKAANQKSIDANKSKLDKVREDNKTADQTIIDLKRENAVLAEKDERKRQDKELENQKIAEGEKINELRISQEKKNIILAQIDTKYKAKQADVETKRKEEDKKKEDDRLKEVQEYSEKLKEIEISAISDTQMKAKAERQKGYDDTKFDLDKALADKKISQDQYDKAIIDATKALNNDLKKIDDDKTKEDTDKRVKKLDDELKFLQIKGEALRVGTQAYWENQLAILNAAQAKELENTELTEAQKTAILEKYTKLRKDLKEQETAANWMVASQTLSAMASVTGAIASSYDEEAKTSKDAFEKRKRLQKATAIMSAASGIIQILAQPSTLPSPFDWIVKGLNAVALGVATGIQIKNIDKTKFEGGGDSGGGPAAGPSTASLGKNYGDGGMINGPRHAAGGVMINAEGGEAVMTRGAVTMFAPLLSALNEAGGGTSFSSGATGGSRPDNAARNNPAAAQEPMIMKTYVVSNELTTEAEKQARLKDLSTL